MTQTFTDCRCRSSLIVIFAPRGKMQSGPRRFNTPPSAKLKFFKSYLLYELILSPCCGDILSHAGGCAPMKRH